MKITVIKKEKDYLEFVVEGENETLLEPLKNALLNDEAVEYANYYIRHPKLDQPVFFVKVAEGKPQNAVKRAAKALINEYKNLLKDFQKQSEAYGN
ncbi:MAG: DNA-directed RNA polymerase subunit L [Candidatus Latescibacterota bacterium]|nr:DNA-directed RNA polymerase subunit L [Thermoplasmata archaeon]RKY69354.1 MAG: DNA-directed RNA polymerase subunit L [Candidatus Latescibacterota bacterium]